MPEQIQQPASEYFRQTSGIYPGSPRNPWRVIEHRLSLGSFSTGARTIPIDQLAQEFGGTSAGAIFIVREENKSSNQIASTQFQLSYVKSAFELSVAKLSRLLGVSRQTIYNWFGDDDESLSTMLAPLRDRLFVLYRAAQIWSDKHGGGGKTPGRFLSHKLSNGKSVLDLLESNDIDWPQLQEGFNAISNLILANNHSQAEKADKLSLSTFSVTPPEARHGTLARLKLTRG